jgi:hypothetical protein
VRSWPSRRAATAWRRHRRAGRHPDLGAGGGPAGLSGRGWVLTGVGLAVEIGDWHRFTGATVGAWLGLVPSEQSSGGRRSQGSITKTGNPHARRLLVEAAWHHRNPDRPSRELRARHHQQPAVVRERADAGNRRLQQRWCQLDARVSAPPSAWSRSPASLPDGAGAWPSWTPNQAFELAGGRHPPARGATRDTPMGSQAASTRRVTLDL